MKDAVRGSMDVECDTRAAAMDAHDAPVAGTFDVRPDLSASHPLMAARIAALKTM